jgi:hypothetical protein
LSIIDKSLNLIGTPDAYGYEIKCPKSETHLLYRTILNTYDLKRVKKEYYWQIVAYMYLTGLNTWNFVSFDPRFIDEKKQLHVVEIEAIHEDLDFFKQRLTDALKIYNDEK